MFCAFHHPELVNVPSYGPSEHTRHDSGQDKTKPSDNAQCNTGLHCRYRFGGGGSSSASVHRKRNFPPLGWMGFDSVLPKHNDNDHITSLLCLTSLFHVVLIASERFIAMKYSLKYNNVVTTRRLAVAIALC